MGSVGFLLIFAAVNSANVKLAKQTGSKAWVSLLGAMLCLAALASLLWQTEISSSHRLWIPFAMIGLAFFIEAAFRFGRDRIINLQQPSTNDKD